MRWILCCSILAGKADVTKKHTDQDIKLKGFCCCCCVLHWWAQTSCLLKPWPNQWAVSLASSRINFKLSFWKNTMNNTYLKIRSWESPSSFSPSYVKLLQKKRGMLKLGLHIYGQLKDLARQIDDWVARKLCRGLFPRAISVTNLINLIILWKNNLKNIHSEF